MRDSEVLKSNFADTRKLGMMTDVGRQRKVDEDSIMTAELLFGVNAKKNAFRLLVVADGMGGHANGEKASKIALDSIAHTVIPHLLDEIPFTKLLESGIQNAHEAVLEHVNNHPETSGMGTTAVCALVQDNDVHLANIGDSRAYVISPGEIRCITKDHSYVQTLIDDGQITEEEARNHPRKNIITKAIGAMQTVEPDTMKITLDIDEYLLLCCDGVIAHLSDKDIKTTVLDSEDPQEMCCNIVDMANKRGGTDNISLIILGPPGTHI